MRYTAFGALLGGSLLLVSCGGSEPETQPGEEAETAMTETGEQAGTDAMPETAAEPDYSDLSAVLDGDWRGDAAERDAWRHPQETLEFLGVDPSSTIVEIWPGGGWYSDILGPWIAANDGTYLPAHFPADAASDYQQRSRAAFETKIADNPLYGDVTIVDFDAEGGLTVEDGSVDAVLTFRNVHNWMNNGFAERAFAEFNDALRPGGILGVVEHRLPSSREQDPMASSGYVQEGYVIAMAEEAGFELVETSEINANPADTADHPFGVWTLPPVRRSPGEGEEGYEGFDRAAFDAIGESDRMTLLFRKPDASEDADTADGGEDGTE
jgi:predicted methyltransferase